MLHQRLPHFGDTGTLQFVTWRVADSLPRDVLEEFLADPDRTSDIAAVKRWQTALDQGLGNCPFREPANAAILRDAFRFFNGERYELVAWVIMPNHVHALLNLNRGYDLGTIVHSLKRHSAILLNRRLGRSGQFWQKDYFDTYIRDQLHADRCIAYIHRNPVEAGLVIDPIEWEFSSARGWVDLWGRDWPGF
ncbi:MAG: transposase [bacterium]